MLHKPKGQQGVYIQVTQETTSSTCTLCVCRRSTNVAVLPCTAGASEQYQCILCFWLCPWVCLHPVEIKIGNNSYVEYIAQVWDKDDCVQSCVIMPCTQAFDALKAWVRSYMLQCTNRSTNITESIDLANYHSLNNTSTKHNYLLYHKCWHQHVVPATIQLLQYDPSRKPRRVVYSQPVDGIRKNVLTNQSCGSIALEMWYKSIFAWTLSW